MSINQFNGGDGEFEDDASPEDILKGAQEFQDEIDRTDRLVGRPIAVPMTMESKQRLVALLREHGVTYMPAIDAIPVTELVEAGIDPRMTKSELEAMKGAESVNDLLGELKPKK